ncbi:hypothetical protein F4779DRAFT_94866 [Xylariaceae sp. FL0662B]|nr:hypothetical protein F4779DRAFT_94866 [Xylariaceae sp. FL0662B]
MRHPLFCYLLPVGIAAASRLDLPAVATRTEDGAIREMREPTPTPPPQNFVSAELSRRAEFTMGHDTCGFGFADPALTYTCYESIGTCENIGKYRGCCTGGLQSCLSTFWTVCNDWNPTSECGTSARTRCCQYLRPYCITWRFSTSSSIFTAWDCDTQSNSRIFQLLATPLSLMSSSLDFFDAGLTTSESTAPSSPSPSTSMTTSSTTSGSIPPEATGSTSTTSSVNTGAIVGGVVGGVAVIGLIGLGVLFLRKYDRRKSSTHEKPPASPPPLPSGPQELAGNGYSLAYSPDGSYFPRPQEATTSYGKPQELSAQSRIVEAPTEPMVGTRHNRAELG